MKLPRTIAISTRKKKGAVVAISRILVCDDDREIVEAIQIYLRHENYDVACAYNGQDALRILEQESIQLVILDIMMPYLDGIRAIVKLRETHHLPVIFLSAKSEDSDKVLGLNLGADDYVTKPFNPLELLARVRAQLRRFTSFGSEVCGRSVWQTAGLKVDDERKEVTVEGEVIKLTPVEYKILKYLCENAGRVFTIEQIYEAVWNEVPLNVANTVAVHIRRIRDKIEINPKEPKFLVLGTAAIRRGETAHFAPTKWHKDIDALAAHVLVGRRFVTLRPRFTAVQSSADWHTASSSLSRFFVLTFPQRRCIVS